MLEWICSVLRSPSRLDRLRKRGHRWEKQWSTPAFSPEWGGRDAPPEIGEAVASGWLPPSGKVLEIGCGLGEIATWFAQRGYDALGVDIAPSAVRQAQAVHAALPHPPKFLAVDLCADVPPGGPFDILIDRGCLHGIPEKFVPDFVGHIAAAGQLSGTTYWASWILVGAVALTCVSFFVVSPLKGEPIPALWPRFASGLALNGAWGFGTALLLRLMARL